MSTMVAPTQRPVIVFVDDEPPVLHALRRQFDASRERWDMHWCVDAASALRVFDAGTVDVVVSDMRMPGVDGAKLLEQVRRRQPGCLRFMLSGYAERAGALHALGFTHQYFSKPCDARRIGDAIGRALRVHELLPTPGLRELVVDALPPPAMPRAASRLLAALQASQPELDEIAGIIESDVGLTAQLLKLVHSSDFAGAELADGVLRAVRRIGLDAIESMAMLAGRFDDFAGSADAVDLQHVETLQARSLGIGRLAQRIAEREGLDARGRGLAAWAGTLSHVGSLLLWRRRPRVMREIARLAAPAGGELERERERDLLGASHAEIGAALLASWGLPDEVVDAVRWHHQPPAGVSGRASAAANADADPAGIVYAAQWLLERVAQAGPEHDPAHDPAHDPEHGVGAHPRLAAWAQLAREQQAPC